MAGVIRGGKSGCRPNFFREITDDLFSHQRLSLLQCHLTSIYFPLKNWPLFCSSLSFLLLSLGCRPHRRCRLAPFLPVRPRFSTVLCKFSHTIFSFGCTLWRMSAGAGLPPPSDATCDIFEKNTPLLLLLLLSLLLDHQHKARRKY